MQYDERFRKLPKSFWASVRTLSQEIGYTERGKGRLRIPSKDQMSAAFSALNLNATILVTNGALTPFGVQLQEYFEYRAKVLHEEAEPNLMNLDRAKGEFEKLHAGVARKCALPMNKQKGDKRSYNYLTGLVNMTIEAHAQGFDCNYDPRELTTITRDGVPVRTLSRRVDGAFPSPINPIAIWEIKEYYYTTTFGSRIADGVYETLLDGMELEELAEHEKIDVQHYLMVDAYDTWWNDGKSYLCRMVDMVNMGYVDEVLFGYQVVTELPRIVKGWVAKAQTSARLAHEPQI